MLAQKTAAAPVVRPAALRAPVALRPLTRKPVQVRASSSPQQQQQTTQKVCACCVSGRHHAADVDREQITAVLGCEEMGAQAVL
eukprot:scaffold196490_cov19-Tisochrysis_lutea.AAC.2